MSELTMFSPGTLVLAAALLLVFAAIIIVPLFDRKRPAVLPPSPREALQRERAEIVRAIRELDFDQRTQKLNDDDHRRLRADLVQRGAAVLRDIDALDASADQPRDIDHEIETAVAAIREKRAATCKSCAALVMPGDRFCPHCGVKL